MTSGQGFNAPQERTEKALGSGVIVSPEGYILTNNHVVDGAKEVTVTLHDKREMKARVIGTDPRTDIAVLKIEGSNFPTLTLADSSKVEVGDIVLAIGDPFGVGQTVTAGIVSATGRGGLGIEQVEDFIQTDAPINPGNSGGALVDDEGHLIGINTAILSGNSGGNQGIGFAVPINMARHDMDEILAHGKVEHGYLGILPQDVTPALAKAFNTHRYQRRSGGRNHSQQPGRAQRPETGRHHRRGEWTAGRGRQSVTFEDRHDGPEHDCHAEGAAERQDAGSCRDARRVPLQRGTRQR